MSQDTLYLAKNVCVRPHHDDPSTFEIAWGEGRRRESFVTASAALASALATAPSEAPCDHEVKRLAGVLDMEAADAEELVAGLRDYGLYRTEPDDLTAAEERWLDVAWADALDLHTATRDSIWVHDYSGNPKVMTRYFVDRNVQPETPPPPRYPVPSGETVQLPPVKPLSEQFDAVQARRRTGRNFRNATLDLADVATILELDLRAALAGRRPRVPRHTDVQPGGAVRGIRTLRRGGRSRAGAPRFRRVPVRPDRQAVGIPEVG